LGLTEKESFFPPTEIEYFKEMKIKEIYCGNKHSFILLGKNNYNLENSTLIGLGANMCGQLGIIDNMNDFSHFREIFFYGKKEIKNIVCGQDYTIIIFS
jgi:hypothetical protein